MQAQGRVQRAGHNRGGVGCVAGAVAKDTCDCEGRGMSKYHAIRTWSDLNQRWFASKKEAHRADELRLLEMGNVISDLMFQKRFVLNEKPRATITIDFCYTENGIMVYEDTKGVMTRDFRTKLAWLYKDYGVEVRIT